MRRDTSLEALPPPLASRRCVRRYRTILLLGVAIAAGTVGTAAARAGDELALDERPAGDREWGYRPAEGFVSAVNPPAFCWRPQAGIASWELECGRGRTFEDVEYRAAGISLNVHCPPQTLPVGRYTWRYRGVDASGRHTAWSRGRTFRVGERAAPLPLPARTDLLARIPRAHPRLFLRPENLPRLRELARGPLRGRFEELRRQCERWRANPPATNEPAKYPDGMRRGTPEWRKLWWGNRVATIAALDAAATLAFTRLVGGDHEYGQLARKILLECARWDPRGATGYRYNDEAGMPYAYHFSRTYTLVHDLLSEEEREQCRRVMRVRGEEMYRHLCPRHLWQPYSSHSNRAWHFLGEVGIAFLGEIEGAEDWVWFAMNVFFNVYPVWSDEDGGWHEGVSYWSSYIGRFTWWADVMRSAMGIDAFDKPYFSRAGDFPLYLMPPGKVGGGFGDGANRRKASDVARLMSQLAVQAENPHWQWYVENTGGPVSAPGYVGFLRGALDAVEARPPEALDASRHFRGTGIACLNTTLLDADDAVQVLFKSSLMGTWSHGNAAQNSFLLWAYGERLLVRTGHYYNYGGPHHRDWVWSTRSLQNITVNGRGQLKRSAAARGRITAFRTSPRIDVVVGEAAEAYRASERDPRSARVLDRYTRAIVFVKPELVVVFDRLVAREPATFQYWIHARREFSAADQGRIGLRVGDVACDIAVLAPEGLEISQTDQYDPNPEPHIRTREWHLTLVTPAPQPAVEFVALYRPRKADRPAVEGTELRRVDGGYVMIAPLTGGGRATALLPARDDAVVEVEGLRTSGGAVLLRLEDAGSTVLETVRVDDRLSP